MISTPLISASEVASVQAVRLDARAGSDAQSQYAAAHLHGAAHLSLEHDLCASTADPRNGGRHPLPKLHGWLATLGALGITPSTPVVIYDDTGGGMAAARAWWMVQAIGHRPVAVVDGGLAALREAGLPIDSDVVVRHPEPPYPSEVKHWPVVDADFVEAMRGNNDARLIDARAQPRFRGVHEPIDSVAGHIPGAINLFWKDQLDNDGRFLERDTLRAKFAKLAGDASVDNTVCYCGSGVTACHLLLGMRAAGLPDAQLYVGSWSEWSRQDRPREPSDKWAPTKTD